MREGGKCELATACRDPVPEAEDGGRRMLSLIPFLAVNQLGEVCCSLRLLATVRTVTMLKTFPGAVSGFLSDDVRVAHRSVRAECR